MRPKTSEWRCICFIIKFSWLSKSLMTHENSITRYADMRNFILRKNLVSESCIQKQFYSWRSLSRILHILNFVLLRAFYVVPWPFIKLRKKWQITEFFLVGIFSYSGWIQRDTEYLSVFSPNTGKYGPEKNPYLDNFHALLLDQNKKLSVTRILISRIFAFVEQIFRSL